MHAATTCLLLASAMTFQGCLFAGATADFYVSPSGNDRNPGTLNKPFASLARARDAVRELKRSQAEKSVLVLLRGGTYYISDSLVFKREDSSPDGSAITYAAYPGETPVLSSGVPIRKWQKVRSSVPGFPAAATGKVWVADLPANMRPFSSLYDGVGRLPRARSSPFSPTKDYRTAEGLDCFTLPFPPGKLKHWSNLRDVELMIRPNYAWVLNFLPLESVDERAGIAKTTVPATYHMIRVRYAPEQINQEGTVWVENVLEALDEPGEWAVDFAQRKLYLWPRDSTAPRNIVAPQLVEFVRVEGNIDYDGPRDTPVQNLVFRGITFTHGDRFGWQRDKIGWGLQHDWEMFDRPTTLLRLRGAEGVSIEKCRFIDSAGGGIRLDLHAQKNQIIDSDFEHLGGVGILLAGYGPGTKDVNRGNQILRNHIHHIGELLWHSPAIFIWQSGENRIANNLIHHTPYTGIVVSGRIGWDRKGESECSRTIRWKEVDAELHNDFPGGAPALLNWWQREKFLHGRHNIVERNEIHDVMQTLMDGNGIYVSGTGRGNIVRENFVHDSMLPTMGEGIRCDDDQHETTLERNVVFRIGGMGDGIAIKGVNNVLNNFLVLLSTHHNHRGYISLEESPVKGSRIQRNILYAGSANVKPYFQKGLFGPDPHLRDTDTDYNLYFNTADPNWAAEHFERERKFGIEAHSLFADPMFMDAEHGDFRFKPGSPAEKLGIQPIDLKLVGRPK